MTESIMNKSIAAVTNGSSPKIVADMISEIVMTEEPCCRYLAGADAETLFKTKKDMSDLELEKFLCKTLGL